MKLKGAVFLCGMMGSGKSTVGRQLARKLRAPYTDLDALIERRERLSIPEIFARRGEPAFRRAESGALKAVPAGARVVALGGGALIRRENREWMRRRGTLLHLRAGSRLLWARLSKRGQGPLRPLLQGGKAGFLALYRRRKALYERADIMVSAAGSKAEVLAKVVKTLKKAGFLS